MGSGTGETSASLDDVKQLLEQITKDCGKISVAKKEIPQLAELCTTFSNRLGDRPLTVEQFNYDDIKSELTRVEGQLAGWSKYSYPKSLVKKKEIVTGIAEFTENLQSIISKFSVTQPTPVPSRAGNHGIDPPDRKSVEAILPKEGVGEDTAIAADQNNYEPLLRQTTGCETPESYSVETNELSPVKRLDGEVKRVGDAAFAGGTNFEVWEGKWEKGNGEDAEKVALKTIRMIRSPARAREKFESELPSWAQLRHPNILPFYGIVTDIEPPRLYMVSPWLKNGNLLVYVKDSQSDKDYLLRGSAAGLSYLHAQGVVHGSVKCKNVLVSDEGEPQICDFGISRIMEEIDGNKTSKTMTSGDTVRYSAPELLENIGISSTTYSDTYSFAMLILECITEEAPFSNIARDAAVVHARIGKRQIPPRPDGPDERNRVSDGLWSLMMRCWSVEPNKRPTMEQVHTFFLQS